MAIKRMTVGLFAVSLITTGVSAIASAEDGIQDRTSTQQRWQLQNQQKVQRGEAAGSQNNYQNQHRNRNTNRYGKEGRGGGSRRTSGRGGGKR